MIYTQRSYTGEADYEAMRDLVRACYGKHPFHYATIGDLDWWRSGESRPDALTARLWFADGMLVGVAWSADDQVDLLVHPDHQQLEAAMLDWGEQNRSVAEQSAYFYVWSFAGDHARVQLYQDRGYQPDGYGLNLRSRSLATIPANVALAPGYRIRHFAGMPEIEARVAVHRDAFAPSRMTIERHAVAMRLPSYRQELDLVVEAPDGTLAAFCIVWHDAANQIGVFEPVGCHSAHRRMGLARAVMAEGQRRLVALGARTAYVSSLAGAGPAEALYESLGFRVVDTNQRWVRHLVR